MRIYSWVFEERLAKSIASDLFPRSFYFSYSQWREVILPTLFLGVWH